MQEIKHTHSHSELYKSDLVQKIEKKLLEKRGSSLPDFIPPGILPQVAEFVNEVKPSKIYFSRDGAITLQEEIMSVLENSSIPQYIRDMALHDAYNEVHSFVGIFNEDGTIDDDLVQGNMPEILNNDFSRVIRLKQGVQKYSFLHPVSSNQIISKAVHRFLMSPYGEGKEVITSVEEPTYVLSVQPIAENIVFNLLKNAALYAKDSKELIISAHKGEYLYNSITVSDFGKTPLHPDHTFVRGVSTGGNRGIFMAAAKQYLEDTYGRLSHYYTDVAKQEGTTFKLDFRKPKIESSSIDTITNSFFG